MFHAIYKKELRTSARSIRIPLVITIYNAILLFIASFSYYIEFESKRALNIPMSNTGILGIYTLLAVIEFGLVIFVVPVITAGTIASEREQQTLDILLSTKVSSFQLVMGKLISSLSMIMVLVISSIPVLSIVFLVGGVNLRNLLGLVGLILITAIFLGSIGVFNSVIFRKTTTASVVTYGVILLIFVVSFLAAGGTHMLQGFGGEGTVNRLPEVTGNVTNIFVLLLLNPLYGLLNMLHIQVGTLNNVFSFFYTYEQMEQVIGKHWFLLSCLVQLVVSGFLLVIASYLIRRRVDKRSIYKRK